MNIQALQTNPPDVLMHLLIFAILFLVFVNTVGRIGWLFEDFEAGFKGIEVIYFRSFRKLWIPWSDVMVVRKSDRSDFLNLNPFSARALVTRLPAFLTGKFIVVELNRNRRWLGLKYLLMTPRDPNEFIEKWKQQTG